MAETPLSFVISFLLRPKACAYDHGDDEDSQYAFNLARDCFQTLMESKSMGICSLSLQ